MYNVSLWGCWHRVTEASVLPVTQGVPADAVYRATPLEAPTRLILASASHNVRHHTTLSQQQDSEQTLDSQDMTRYKRECSVVDAETLQWQVGVALTSRVLLLSLTSCFAVEAATLLPVPLITVSRVFLHFLSV